MTDGMIAECVGFPDLDIEEIFETTCGVSHDKRQRHWEGHPRNTGRGQRLDQQREVEELQLQIGAL